MRGESKRDAVHGTVPFIVRWRYFESNSGVCPLDYEKLGVREVDASGDCVGDQVSVMMEFAALCL